ncbi:MAG: ABC transporter permease [Gemmatimonadota bacterium]|nr:MAG: ABC transporter permease [Gemmatimonadota bacterium]
MRLIGLLRKTMIENLRDWKILVMTLTLAPFFTVLMYLYFESATQAPHRIVVVNHDEGATTALGHSVNAGHELISEMENAKHADGSQVLRVLPGEDGLEAQKRVADGAADLVVEIPHQFSRVLQEHLQGDAPPPALIRTYGDPTNPRYLAAAAWSDAIVYLFAAAAADVQSPVELDVQTVTGAGSLSDFDLYVPGLLSIAVIMLMFTAAASLIKEKDKGTIVRLRVSNMTTFEWLTAVTLTQIVLGVLAVVLTLGTATALGYERSGSLTAMTLVSVLSCLAMIAVSVVVAAWLRTIFDLMTIGCFPFFILLFFSGAMFPLPQVRLLEIAGRSLNVNDILPVTHSIAAFDKILNRSAGLNELAFEMGSIAVLSVVFFVVGTWLFTKRHMRGAGRWVAVVP